MTWQFTLSGFLIGALVGMTGMGGGSLLTPILVIFFGFKPTLAVGTDILHGAIFKSFGAVRHRRLGTVHARLTFWMFLGSGPMSLLGVTVASALGDSAQKKEGYAVGVALRLAEPLAVDPYAQNRATGSFVLVDEATNETVAAGMIETAA